MSEPQPLPAALNRSSADSARRCWLRLTKLAAGTPDVPTIVPAEIFARIHSDDRYAGMRGKVALAAILETIDRRDPSR
jgi:hypothetical protein